MHYALIVVCHPKVICLVFLEIRLLIRLNVVPVDDYVVIPALIALHVIEAEGMQKLMNDYPAMHASRAWFIEL